MLSKLTKNCLITGLLVLMLVFCATSREAAASQKLISIAATGSASSLYVYHVTVAQLLNKKLPEIQVSVLETGAALDNLRRMRKKEADLAQFAEPDFYEFYNGLGPFEGKPNPNLRWGWLINPIVYNWVASKDSGIKRLQDFDGKKMCPGARGSNTEKMTEDIFNILGVKPQYFRAGYGDAVAAMKDRRIVGYVKAAPLNAPESTILDVSAVIPINILNFTDGDIEKIKQKYPYYDFLPVASGIYKGVDAYTTRGIFLGMGVQKDLEEELVYKMVKTVCENADFQAASYPAVKGIKFAEFTLKHAQSPLHPGTIKYLKALGHKIPAKLIPSELK